MSRHGCNGKSGCSKLITQNAEVQLPLDINVYAELGEVRTQCCGEPEIQIVHRCGGCKLIVSQRLTVTIAVEYGADVTAEESQGSCTGEVCV